MGRFMKILAILALVATIAGAGAVLYGINTLAPQSSRAALEAAADAFDALTGVLGIVQHREKEAVPADVMALVAARAEAKKAKDWARADALRAEIGEKGYAVEDTPQGPKVLKK